MKTTPFAMLAAAMLLTGCQSLNPNPYANGRSEAFRAHLGQPIAPAAIVLAPINLARANDPVMRNFIGAVASELSRLGFTPVADVGRAELLGTVVVASGSAADIAGNAPAGLRGLTTLGPGPATGLMVQIRRRSDGSIIWQGRSATLRMAPGGDISMLAGPLAQSLFLGFPGLSGRTIRTP